MRILIVEDSIVLRDALVQGLREAGYAVDAVGDGKRGLIHAQTSEYDVIILDWMLPDIDGITVLSTLRAKRIQSSVLMLTARDSTDDKVNGLSNGADDYLVKPFAFKELLARVAALARRVHSEHSSIIRIGPLSIHMSTKTVRVSEQAIELAPREYALIEYLALRRGKPSTRAELEEHLYADGSHVFSNAIDAAIYTLRRKLDAAGCPSVIQTRRKFGYVLQAIDAQRGERTE